LELNFPKHSESLYTIHCLLMCQRILPQLHDFEVSEELVYFHSCKARSSLG
jgi:hypothetical protein